MGIGKQGKHTQQPAGPCSDHHQQLVGAWEGYKQQAVVTAHQGGRSKPDAGEGEVKRSSLRRNAKNTPPNRASRVSAIWMENSCDQRCALQVRIAVTVPSTRAVSKPLVRNGLAMSIRTSTSRPDASNWTSCACKRYLGFGPENAVLRKHPAVDPNPARPVYDRHVKPVDPRRQVAERKFVASFTAVGECGPVGQSGTCPRSRDPQLRRPSRACEPGKTPPACKLGRSRFRRAIGEVGEAVRNSWRSADAAQKERQTQRAQQDHEQHAEISP